MHLRTANIIIMIACRDASDFRSIQPQQHLKECTTTDVTYNQLRSIVVWRMRYYLEVDEHNNCNYLFQHIMKAFRTVSRASDRELLNQYYQEHKIPIFFPWSVYYRIWWFLTVIAALFGMFLETYEIAFSQAGWSRRSAIMEITISCIFGLDVIINFNLAYYDERDKIVLARLPIAMNYLKRMFWVDLIGVFPFYYVALAISGQMGESNALTQNLALLRLFTLVRLHRVPRFFSIMKYSSKISLISLTLIRDLSAVLTWTHIWACIMFFIARELAFDPDNTWLGGDIANLTGFEQYVTSLYWSV
eukprot:scaffold37261_cov80-Skeletonema_marinoi.AAC.1